MLTCSVLVVCNAKKQSRLLAVDIKCNNRILAQNFYTWLGKLANPFQQVVLCPAFLIRIPKCSMLNNLRNSCMSTWLPGRPTGMYLNCRIASVNRSIEGMGGVCYLLRLYSQRGPRPS
jgi:hypothetical protein